MPRGQAQSNRAAVILQYQHKAYQTQLGDERIDVGSQVIEGVGFGMVLRQQDWLALLPTPAALPGWLTEADLDAYTAALTASGLRVG